MKGASLYLTTNNFFSNSFSHLVPQQTHNYVRPYPPSRALIACHCPPNNRGQTRLLTPPHHPHLIRRSNLLPSQCLPTHNSQRPRLWRNRNNGFRLRTSLRETRGRKSILLGLHRDRRLQLPNRVQSELGPCYSQGRCEF